MLEENKPSSPSSAGSAASALVTGRRRSKMHLNQYARFATAEARRFKEGFTRENIIAFLRTLVWTIPITVIIWVYAEQQTSIPLTHAPVKIAVKSSDPTKIATLVQPADAEIICDLFGPRANVDRLKQSPDNPLVIPIDAVRGEFPMSTLETIRANSYFKDQGVAVTNCSPAQLVIDVDTLDEREVPVVAPADLLSLQSASFTPATVKIKGPHRVLDAMAKSDRLAVTADISNLQILGIPGQHPPVAVPLVPPEAGSNVTFTTSTVQATLTVKEADVQYELGKVNVEVQAPGALYENFKISPAEPIISGIKVVGPPDKIDLLKNRQIFPIAVMHIETDDIHNPRPMPLEIRYLPEGVRLAPGSNPTMSFSAVDR
jgi:hypothetical protein